VAIPSFPGIWRAARAVEKVFELDANLKTALGEIELRLAEMERRILQLEADKREMVTEAKAAAATAASAAASAHLTDLARQVGALQEQMRHAGDPPAGRRRTKRIAPPADDA